MGQGWRSTLVAVLAVMLAGSQLLATEPAPAPAPTPHKPQKKASATSSHGTHHSSTKHTQAASVTSSHHTHDASTKRTQARTTPHPSTVHTRLAHMQVAPDRVEQIQRALIDAGQLHGSPSGRWDAETRDAMSRYQAASGFGVTGLPDAKSLMKLGLGPHPLPESLNPPGASAGSASVGEEVPSSPEGAVPADSPPNQPAASTDPHLK